MAITTANQSKMKLNPPRNINYAATVCRLKTLLPLEKCDNVVGAQLFGSQAIVGKDSQEGDWGIVFPAECQLSEEYCKQNNLFRHKEKNADQTKAGYIEDSRRVKAVKFRGHTSSCLFMPLESLVGFMEKGDEFAEGDTFDELNGLEVCKKYEILINGRLKGPANTPKQPSRVEQIFFPEHISTENYWRNADKIPSGAEVIVTQKIHGTSVRIANTIVNRKLTLRDRLAKLFGAKVQETEHAYVFGSRKVTKDINNPNQQHYYAEDIWTTEGKKLEGLVPENFLVYAELVGFTPTGKPIQEGYTYGLPENQCALYVYRVAFVNPKGLVTDLSWDQVKQFCRERGLNHVVEIWRGKHDRNFVVEKYLEKRLLDEGFDRCLPLSDAGTVDEGVCIRVDGLVPLLLKAKSQAFLRHETALLDKQVVDLETAGSQT